MGARIRLGARSLEVPRKAGISKLYREFGVPNTVATTQFGGSTEPTPTYI
ncbi:hypothetical protein GE21DRAFT_1209475 [Neurospora crassa]|nr:hypothetical protein GE21DRAFT_1209475 [Neurospora crassa]